MTFQVIRSDTFLHWLENLRDERAQARIATRIERVEEGNFGDHKSVGQGVSEMRVREGQACRLYYTIRDNTTIILLCGGDKSGQLCQQRDIERAHQMARDWK